jgi:hypothetical protein
MRRYAGKLNHLKTSDNLDIGTKKNVVSDFIGRNINRMNKHQKLWVQVGRGVTAKKKKPENVRLRRTGIIRITQVIAMIGNLPIRRDSKKCYSDCKKEYLKR